MSYIKKMQLKICVCLPAASKSCAIMSTHIVACLLLYRHRQVCLQCRWSSAESREMLRQLFRCFFTDRFGSLPASPVSDSGSAWLTLCDPMDCNLPGSSVHGILQATIPEWVAIPFSRGIFPTQGSNPGLPHCKQILYRLSHQGSPVL